MDYDEVIEQMERLGYDGIGALGFEQEVKTKVMDEIGEHLMSILDRYPKLEETIKTFKRADFERSVIIRNEKFLSGRGNIGRYDIKTGNINLAYNIH